MKSRVYYEVDPHNRLIVESGKRSRVKGFRKVIRGRFKTDSKNTLYYEVFKSSETDTPQKIKFSGAYSLDKKQNLIFTLDKWNNQREGNRLRLRTKILDANTNEIVFVYTSRISEKKRRISIMRLHGSWQADKHNRLRFGVKKGNGQVDDLTLFKSWKVNNNEIVYSHGRDGRVVTLRGQWQIKDRHRLGYVLEKGINSGFNFRTSLGQVIPRGRKTYIRFEIAIDISKRKRIRRKIFFTCRCKHGKGRKIILEVSPRKRDTSIRLTKEILNQKGLAYIESFLKEKEGYLGGGLALRW